MNDDHARAFTRDLRARNRAPRTIASYLDAVSVLRRHLDDTDLAEVTRADLQGFFAAQLDAHSAATAAIRFRSLQQFFKWATAEGICGSNPMLGMSPPSVAEKPVAVLTLGQVKRLLDVCGGKSFDDRRDTALLRLFLEPGGLRLSEMAGLRLADLDLREDTVTVLGKGRKERTVPFGLKTGQALERYKRARDKHPSSQLTALWLGSKGPLTISGIQQMMRRRASQAGLPHLHPHMLRHTAAHEWLNAGGQETDAMALFGWRSRDMLSRYGKSAAAERAKNSARRMGLGDRY